MANKTPYLLGVTVVLALKGFKVRCRNSVLGFVWLLLNPLGRMVILTLMRHWQSGIRSSAEMLEQVLRVQGGEGINRARKT